MIAVKLAQTPVIAGIDEAGRGPLAGPVVAAACVLPHGLFPQPHARWSPVKKARRGSCIIADSKILSPEERETAFEWITRNCPWGIGMVESGEIDRIGILEAVQSAMQQAVDALAERIAPTYLLVDGRDAFWFDYPHSSIIDGDAKEPTIAAASIIAKVTRDRIMIDWDSRFPLYGFSRHKGYGTPEHISAILRHGLTHLHRRTFLKKLTKGQQKDYCAPSTTREESPQQREESSVVVRD